MPESRARDAGRSCPTRRRFEPSIRNGSSVRLKAVDTEDRVQPDATDVTLATVTLTGQPAGEVGIDAVVESADDEEGSALSFDVDPATLPVTELAPVDGDDPPQDTDDDGLYEDINANGRVDFDDVAEFFQHLDEPSVTTHTGAYDYSGDGSLGIQDVLALFDWV